MPADPSGPPGDPPQVRIRGGGDAVPAPSVRITGGPPPGPPLSGADVLVGGEPGPPSRAGRRRRRVAIALVALAALGLVMLAGDRWLRQREFSQLLAHTASGRASAAYASARVAASISYASPLITSNAATPEQRRSLEQIVQDAAGGQVAAVRVERQRTAAVRVLPWHAAQRTARTRSVAYLQGRVEYLSSVAADFDALYRTQPQARDELAAARAALRAAAPDAAARTRVGAALP